MNLIPSNSLKTLVEAVTNHSLKRIFETRNIKKIQTEHTQVFCHKREWYATTVIQTLARRQLDIQLIETPTRRGWSGVGSMAEGTRVLSCKKGCDVKHLPLLL